jgi:ankyrin repeat protein
VDYFALCGNGWLQGSRRTADMNAKNDEGRTPLDEAVEWDKPEIADLLHKHGGKTGAELKAEGK